jgi:type I restriction enzyme S subunit
MIHGCATVPIGDLCRIVGGGTPSRKNEAFYQGDIPWVTVKDFDGLFLQDAQEHITQDAVGSSATNIIPADSVLVVTRVGLGKVALTTRPLAINQDVKALIPDDRVIPEYLLWFMTSYAPEIERIGVGATVKGVTLKDLKSIQVPVPSLAEQRRIVDILKRADGIRRLRKQAIQTARELIPALFVDIFGDPATNPKGWGVAPFSTVGTLDRGRSRHRPRNDPSLFGGPHPFIQTGEVANSGGRIRNYSTTYSEKGLSQSHLWPKGTLCITIAANIAETGVLEFNACFPDSVVGFLPGPQVTTDFVQAWLAFLQPTLEANAPQLAQKNINLKILGELPIPIPPIDLQQEFSRQRENVESVIGMQGASNQQSDDVFQSLLHRAFRGEL